MKQMKKTEPPLVLTVKGKAEAVLLDAAAYQEVASQPGAPWPAFAAASRKLAKARGARQMKCLTNWNAKTLDNNSYNRT
jgi:hypothetical protein